jgi:chromosome partitioning protein
MKVIVVAQQKGGAGKTTLCVQLGAALAERGRVLLIDTDPQQTLTRWAALRAARGGETKVPLAIETLSGWRVSSALARHGADFVLVDTPPKLDGEARLVLREADLVLVPMQPALPDLWAAETVLGLIGEIGPEAALVLNRVPASGKLAAEIGAELARRGLPHLAATLGNRVLFAQSFARGLGVSEAASSSPAAAEIGALAAEVGERLGLARPVAAGGEGRG